jgi:hypothetical protein
LFAHAVGQLTVYNSIDPKEELQIYLFGQVRIKKQKLIIDLLIKQGFVVHTFKIAECSITIHCHNSDLDVFTKIVD